MVVSLQPTLRSIFWKAWVQCWFQQTGFKTCPCKDDGFHSAPALKKTWHQQQGAVSSSGTASCYVLFISCLMLLMFRHVVGNGAYQSHYHLDLHKWLGKTQ